MTLKLIVNVRTDSNSSTQVLKITYGASGYDLIQVIGLVILIHLVILGLAKFDLPSFKMTKRPDITIEVGASPAASNGPSAPAAMPEKKVSNNTLKEKQILSRDRDAPSAPPQNNPTTTTSSSASS